MRDSHSLVLDEPASALDSETEKYLAQSLREAAESHLVVAIANEIVLLENGQAVRQSSREELIAWANGHNRRFVDWHTMTAGRTADDS